MTTIHKIKWGALSVIAILLIIVVAQNTGQTTIQFFAWRMEAPRVILLLGIALGSFAAGVLTTLLLQRHRHSRG